MFFERCLKLLTIIGAFASAVTVVVVVLQLKDSRETRILDEKAFVAPVPITLTLHYSNGPSFYSVILHNYGRTVARKVVIEVGATNTADAIPEPEIEPKISFSFLAPSGETTVDSQFISHEMWDAAKAGKIPLFIYGTVWYEDIFGHSHWTEFCWSVDVNRNVTFEGPKHNECDSNY